ncbi:MAG: hypothetical protein K0Q71_3621 [Thermomicrobiales bacterium]|nr:hypothetical protein [Thermomicrobiales bacterium]
MEKSVPDPIRRAYGAAPSVLADLPDDDPHLAAVNENARASLLKQGYLTEEDLDTLSVRHADTPGAGQPGPGHEGAAHLATRIGVA